MKKSRSLYHSICFHFGRATAICLGISLIVGESIRSWGQGRDVLAIVDDFFVGVALIASALLLSRESTLRYCTLCAAFAATTGLLYGSFTSKLLNSNQLMASNIDSSVLTCLIGIAFVAALTGLCTSFCCAYAWSTRQKESS